MQMPWRLPAGKINPAQWIGQGELASGSISESRFRTDGTISVYGSNSFVLSGVEVLRSFEQRFSCL